MAPLSAIFHLLFLQNLLGLLSAAALATGPQLTMWLETALHQHSAPVPPPPPALDATADRHPALEWVRLAGPAAVRTLRWWNLVAPLGAPMVAAAGRC